MKRDLFFSVIIPTYNRRDALEQTIRCVLLQSYPSHRYELIVVDDGSTDSTGKYLQQLAFAGSLRFISQRNAGPAAARNAGAQIAHGEVLVFTDDDCLPEPGWLAALDAGYNNPYNQYRAAIGGPVRNQASEHWLNRLAAVQEQHRSNDAEAPEFLDTANASYRRTVFLQVGGFREFLPFPSSEDTDLSLRCIMAGYALHSMPDAIVYHAGRTCLRSLLKQSWLRGISEGYIRVMYATFRAFTPSEKWSGMVHLWLNRMVALVDYTPLLIRPLIRGGIVSFRMALLTVSEMCFFFCTLLPRQVVRYHMQKSTSIHIGLYLLVESLCYLLRWMGRVVGTFRCEVRETGWQRISRQFHENE